MWSTFGSKGFFYWCQREVETKENEKQNKTKIENTNTEYVFHREYEH